MIQAKVLITTPDYPPKLGGLSTYTLDLENCLRQIFSRVDVFVWHNYKEIKTKADEDYVYIFNVNYLAGYLGRWDNSKNINIIHGTEILFHSSNIFKRIYKKLFKYRILNYFEKSKKNIFISEFTFEKLNSFGFLKNYARDLVFHNCINTLGASLFQKNTQQELVFCCIARDVPHKNIAGVVDLVEKIKERYKYENVTLFLNTKNYGSTKIKIIGFDTLDDQKRDEVYQKSHYNILLSLDHSHLGFFEGFGLTCLEAAKFGTPSIVSASGGLPENVHDGINGLVYESSKENDFFDKLQFQLENYSTIQEHCFKHVMISHDLSSLKDFISRVII